MLAHVLIACILDINRLKYLCVCEVYICNYGGFCKIRGGGIFIQHFHSVESEFIGVLVLKNGQQVNLLDRAATAKVNYVCLAVTGGSLRNF